MWTLRNRLTAYDNIAVGSATGKERTIAGNAGSSEVLGGTENLRCVSETTAGTGTSWHTSGPADNIYSGQTTFGTSDSHGNERIGPS